MPEKVAGEKLSTFVSRYVSSKRAKKDFPSIKQRLAVAYSEGGEKKKRK